MRKLLRVTSQMLQVSGITDYKISVAIQISFQQLFIFGLHHECYRNYVNLEKMYIQHPILFKS